MTTPLLECTVLQLGLASISRAGRWVCPECRGEIASVLVAEPAINAHRAGCSRRPTLPWQPSDGPRERPVTHDQIAALFTVDEIRAALSDRAEYMHIRPPVLKTRSEKLHAARNDIGDRATLMCAMIGLSAHESDALRAIVMQAFSAGYEAAEPDVCARCGAEIEGER